MEWWLRGNIFHFIFVQMNLKHIYIKQIFKFQLFFTQTLQSQPTALNGNGQTVAIGDAGIDSAGCLSGTTTGFVF